MTILTEQEVARNMRAVAHAIAQQELEGLKVVESTVDDLRRAAQGEIDTDEVRRNIVRRLPSVSSRMPASDVGDRRKGWRKGQELLDVCE
jgi:hypothetical protein